MNATIAITNLDNARERYKAFRRGEKTPPMKSQTNLTAEQTDILVNKLAKVLVDLYRADMKGELK